VRAHTQFARASVSPRPPEKERSREEEAGDDPPAALVERRDAQPITGGRWLQREPKQLANELHRAVVDRSKHVHADDGGGKDATNERGEPEAAEVDGAKLRVANLACPVIEQGLARARAIAVTELDTHVNGASDLHGGEKVLVISHVCLLLNSLATATKWAC